jgi:hypothetical protein
LSRHFFEGMTALLVVASLGFFYVATTSLARHDYVSGLVLSTVGLATLVAGSHMARLALADRA